MKKKSEEEFFKDIMSKSKLNLPFPDFEDEVMLQIKSQELTSEISSKNIKRSWLVFVSGIIFGILLSVQLQHLDISLFGISPDNMLLVFQLLFTLFVLFSLDSLIQYTRKLGVSNLFGKIYSF